MQNRKMLSFMLDLLSDHKASCAIIGGKAFKGSGVRKFIGFCDFLISAQSHEVIREILISEGFGESELWPAFFQYSFPEAENIYAGFLIAATPELSEIITKSSEKPVARRNFRTISSDDLILVYLHTIRKYHQLRSIFIEQLEDIFENHQLLISSDILAHLFKVSGEAELWESLSVKYRPDDNPEKPVTDIRDFLASRLPRFNPRKKQ